MVQWLEWWIFKVAFTPNTPFTETKLEAKFGGDIMHYRPPQSNFRGGHVPRVPRGIYAYDARDRCQKVEAEAKVEANVRKAKAELASRS